MVHWVRELLPKVYCHSFLPRFLVVLIRSMFPGMQEQLPLPTQREIYSVARLNRAAKRVLESGFPLVVWVEGEISNLAQPTSGHIYFSLKDDQAQVRCALFRTQLRRLGTTPSNGAQVLVRARVSLYEGRGEFQLIVEELEEAGEGALRRALEALKRRLADDGLFDLAHKKPLPILPKRIGIITSPTGAVLHDVVTTLRRRFPAIPVLLYTIPVQGSDAANEIVAAINLASARRDCDALILTRGGGSLEDLWAFNEEAVARAIYSCQVPIVCGVGHETDVTIADFVADVRAPTPTAAAELLSPDQNEWAGHYGEKERRLLRAMQETLSGKQQKLDWLNARLVHPRQRIILLAERLHNLRRRLRSATVSHIQVVSTHLAGLRARLSQVSPAARVGQLTQRCVDLDRRFRLGIDNTIKRQRQRLAAAVQNLNTLSPLATLERGYAIVGKTNAATIIRDASEVKPGDGVTARLARGRLGCIVQTVDEE